MSFAVASREFPARRGAQHKRVALVEVGHRLNGRHRCEIFRSGHQYTSVRRDPAYQIMIWCFATDPNRQINPFPVKVLHLVRQVQIDPRMAIFLQECGNGWHDHNGAKS